MKVFKHLFTFLFAILLSHTSFGQGWERIFDSGGSGDDIGEAVIPTLDGGFILTGAQFGNQIVVMKTNSGGFLEWQQNYGMGATGEDIQLASSDGYILLANSDNGPRVLKLSIDGNIEWEFTLSDAEMDRGRAIRETSDGNFVIAGNIVDADSSPISITPAGVLLKVDAQGNILWETVNSGEELNVLHTVELTNDGGYIVAGTDQNVLLAYANYIAKHDANGTLEWERAFNTGFDGWGNLAQQTSDGGYILAGSKKIGNPNTFPTFSDNIRLVKLNADGTIQWDKDYGEDDIINEAGMGVVETFDGGFAVVGLKGEHAVLLKTDANGELLWEKTFGSNGESGLYNIKKTVDGFIMTGKYQPPGNNSFGIYLVRTDEEGRSFSNSIQGFVRADDNENCVADMSEPALKQWLVQALGTNFSYAAVTNQDGFYNIPVDTGDYLVEVTPISTYWQPCDNLISVSQPSFGDSVIVDFSIDAAFDCPLMEVSISTPFLRRCFENNYTVYYCNQGTVDADSVQIEVVFDEYLAVLSSSLPWTSQMDSLYVFDVGPVDFGECSSFQITVLVDCDSTILGQTHCVEATIFPDSLCLPLNSLWDESNIAVHGYCDGDSLRFEIENNGTGNMESTRDYIIIEDHIILREESFQLPAGGKEIFSIPSNGTTIRLQTSQVDGHPIGNMPSVTIEGCNPINNSISLGFVNQFPQDDDMPFVDIDCQENIGSYDPNDKRAYPIGYEAEHYIEANTPLEYLIRFQNTGTDTAFRVVVEDILSPHLDLTTVVPGASSHPYTYEVRNERTMQFIFNNILLPDSTTNEPASHGFIKFKVQQQRDNPLGTVIENTAGIYFDFNEPIITNTVFHKIGEDFIDSNIVNPTNEYGNSNTKVLVYPNPFSDYTIFEIQDETVTTVEFQLYNVNGQLMRQSVHAGNTFKFEKGDLSTGMYFYQLSSNGKQRQTGKIMIE